MKVRMLIPFLLLAGMAPAQQIKWNYDKLAAKASDSTEVTLDGALLRQAAKFLSNEGDEAQAKKVVAGLKGIYVRSFEFKKAGEYTKEDVDAFRAQIHAPEWQKVVDTHSKEDGEDTEVYLKNGAGDTIEGLTIISAEPKELTLVNIVGTIDLASLGALGGHFGIPDVGLDAKDSEKKR
jgi:hypothetical protein